MTSKESAILGQMEELGFSHGMIMTAMRILGQSKKAQDDALLYLYDEHPSEKQFVEYIAGMCEKQ